MAARLRISRDNLENEEVFSDSATCKQNEMQKVMEKLHRRSGHVRHWTDSIKAVRQAISNEKKSGMEKESDVIQTCLDRLHSSIRVVSQQMLLERLESAARHVGLTFTPPSHSEKSATISSDMFKIEIIFDPGGKVKDVRVCHQGEPSSCDEMAEVLSQGEYEEFTSHMEGLLNIYNISGDKKQRSKAFLALQSLETDLNGLAQLQSSIKGVSNCIHKSPLGILLPRKGGCPMKMIYFVSPYDLLNKKTKSLHPMTVEAITEHSLGQSVTVCLEQHRPLRLQTMPLMSVVPQDGKSLPSFQGPNQVNSAMLPACFTLKLPKPVPVAVSIVQAIQGVTDLAVITEGDSDTLLNLLLKEAAADKLCPGTEFYVTLPDQQHAYYLSDVGGQSLDQSAVMVSRIPFTHPTSVAQVLNLLRQQLLFNTVVGSCIRPYAKQDLSSSVVFELVSISLHHFTIMFEHPLQDTMVTVEVDLSDITGVKFKVCIGEDGDSLLSDDDASKIFQRCLSIPVTLRSVIFKVSEQLRKEPSPEPAVVAMEIDQNPFKWAAELSFVPPSYRPLEKGLSENMILESQFSSKVPAGLGSFPAPAAVSDGNISTHPKNQTEEEDVPANNPLLVTLLDQDSPDPEPPPCQESPMLSKLLEDTTYSGNKTNTALLASSVPAPPQKNPRGRPAKRRSVTDIPRGKSPKHRVTDIDYMGHSFESMNSIDSDSQSIGSVDSTPRHHHLSGSSSSLIDLTEEPPMRKLENTFDNFMPKHQHHIPNDPSLGMADIRSEFDPSREATLYQSNSVPKNETRSTSLEDYLNRSGEVSQTKDLPKPHQDDQLLKVLVKQNSSPQLHHQISVESNESFKSGIGFSRSTSFPHGSASDSDTSEQVLCPSKSCDMTFEMGAINDLKVTPRTNFLGTQEGKFQGQQDLRSLLQIGRKENNIYSHKDIKVKSSEEGKVRMKISGLRTNSELLDITGGSNKKSSVETFDFNSDDEEFDDIRVISASPNRNKNSKLFLPKFIKSEKIKKKESKNTEPGKRKRDKGEKERKKKKRMLTDSRSASFEVYSATPVESEGKTSTKLKIIKSSGGLGVSLENSPKSSPSNKEKGDNSKKYDGKIKTGGQRSSKTVQNRSLSVSSVSVSKEDSKLMTKTPTIKLKPIAIPTSSSLSSVRTPPVSSPTQSKSGSSTPTSTTIGRIGAVSFATSGNSKTGHMTPPPSSSGKATTPTSAKTPPILGGSKSLLSNSKSAGFSSTSSKAAALDKKISQSSRLSSGSSKSSNGSSKHSSDRKSSSPSLSGSRSCSNSSKSLNSSSKGQSSTSNVKNASNPLNSVLSFLNPKDKGIQGLPRIPKISSATSSSNNSKVNTTVPVSSTTVTTPTSSSVSLSALGSGKVFTVNSQQSGSKMSTNYPPKNNILSSPGGGQGKSTTSNSSQPSNKNSSTSNVMGKSNMQNSSTSNSSGNKGNISVSPGNSSNNRTTHSGNSINKSPGSTGSNSKSPVNVSCSGKSPSSHANKPSNLNRQNSSSSSRISVGSGSSSNQGKTPTTGSPNINKSVTVNSKPSVQGSTNSYLTKISNSSGNLNNSLKNGNNTIINRTNGPPKSNTANSCVKISGSPNSKPQTPVKTSSSPLTINVDTPKKQTNSMVSPTSSCPMTNSARVRSRKNSLSAVIDKLTSAKVPHCQEDRKSGVGKQTILIDGESVKHGRESVSVNIENSDKHVREKVNHVGEGQCLDLSEKKEIQCSEKGKEYKIEDNSRNLFASILKSASENFSSKHDKDDKENVSKVDMRRGTDSHEDHLGRHKDVVKKTPSPAQSPKVNGETSNSSDSGLNHKKTDNEKDVFKVPTPKTSSIEDNDSEDTENIAVKRKTRISTTKPVLSPASPVSSPENLIIDCNSPRQTLQNKTNSPKCIIDLSDDSKKLNIAFRPKTHSASPKTRPSPIPSPMVHSSPISHPSPVGPCDIDDDLMNEAIMGFTS